MFSICDTKRCIIKRVISGRQLWAAQAEYFLNEENEGGKKFETNK